MRAASIEATTSHDRVTSTSSVGTSTLPLDKSGRNKTQEGLKSVEEARGTRTWLSLF
jgi:hypothetical protein